MLNQWAQCLTDVLVRHNAIESSRRPVFTYGFQLLLSTSFSISSVLVISAFLSRLPAALTFLTVFISLRLFNGGVHASTYGRCFLLTNAISFAVLAGSACAGIMFPVLSCPLPYVLITLISMGIIVCLSPVKHINHPLSEQRYKRNQKIGRCLVCVYSGLNCILIYTSCGIADPGLIAFTLMAVAIMMIIPQFTERRN